MAEHERTTGQPTHTDFGATEHERRMDELDETPGGDARHDEDDTEQANVIPGAGSDEGSSHGGVPPMEEQP
jgi:hypothetical protein